MILDRGEFIFGIVLFIIGFVFLLDFRKYMNSWKSECKKIEEGKQIDSDSYFMHLLWGWSSLMAMGGSFVGGLVMIYLSMCEPL